MMSRIRGKDTQPELQIRRALFERGFRYRLHVRHMPGTPDLVFPKYCAVVFVNGCFWHGHDCPFFRWPTTRPDFWRAKITRNTELDRLAQSALLEMDWRVLTVWECALRGRDDDRRQAVYDATADWLRGDATQLELDGDLCREDQE